MLIVPVDSASAQFLWVEPNGDQRVQCRSDVSYLGAVVMTRTPHLMCAHVPCVYVPSEVCVIADPQMVRHILYLQSSTSTMHGHVVCSHSGFCHGAAA